MPQPTFSVIVPTYNRAYRLSEVIRSILQQTYADWELILVDDGSTDDTRGVVAGFLTDPRIRYVFQENQGRAQARNTGMVSAQGSIITYIDSDDPVYPNYLEIAYSYFKSYPQSVFATCGYKKRHELIDADRNVLASKDVTETIAKDTIRLQDHYHWKVKACGTGIFHTRKPLEDHVRWDASLRVLEDLDFIMQMGRLYPHGYIHIPEPLFNYVQQHGIGSDGICANLSYGDMAQGFEDLFAKHQDDPLMQGQTWYPQKVDEYRKLQQEFDAGTAPSPVSRYFPGYFSQK